MLLTQNCKHEKPHSNFAELKNIKPNVTNSYTIPMKDGKMLNPYSLGNIRSFFHIHGTGGYPDVQTNDCYLIIKFNPADIDSNNLEYTQDSLIEIFNFPINSPRLYDGTATEETLDSLHDGYLYSTVPIGHTIMSHVNVEILDTIYKPAEDDELFTTQLMLHAGYFVVDEDTAMPIAIHFPKPHKPEGFVTYHDEQLSTVGSKMATVWALDFGIPRITYSESNGHYKINRGFWIGSIMGVMYKNWRAIIKPFNTSGATASTAIGRFIQKSGSAVESLIIGARHSVAFVGYGSLQSKNFHWGGHTPVRFWAHIMNRFFDHDAYCDAENITKSPLAVVVYAWWDGNPDFGGGAPMLGHISLGQMLVDEYISKKIFHSSTSLTSCVPTLFNLLSGFLPDYVISADSDLRDYHEFSCEISQDIFHELSHGSYFLRVGIPYWAKVIGQEAENECDPNTVYGCGNWQNSSNKKDIYIQLTEAWAEFLGQNFTKRIYPSGTIYSDEMSYKTLADLREDEHYFADNWIPKGIFNDLMDGNGTLINSETWDNINGKSIKQLFEVFGSTIRNVDEYRDEYMSQFSSTSLTDLQLIIDKNLGL
jgi:hypothetical protein